jgi:predicted transposase/invertase (TIGR01784 family)
MLTQNGPEAPQIFSDCDRIVLVELPKFDPKSADEKDALTAWLAFLKNPTLMNTSFLGIKEVKEAMDVLQYISADSDTRAIAELREKTMFDRNSERAVAVEEGEAIGEARGKAEGEAKKARETAIAMLADGMPVEVVRKYTELPIEEIEALQKLKN